MTSIWIVRRIEEHGNSVTTQDLGREEAETVYATWCSKLKKSNDQSVALIRIDRTETVVTRHINTSFESL